MRILLVHNEYQLRGGEDAVFRAEGNLLREHGLEVLEYLKSNVSIGEKGSIDVAAGAVWSRNSYRELRSRIREMEPSIVHVHNYMPLISPAVFFAAHAEGVPVVQTLHNYRLLCLNGMLMREEKICELCATKNLKWPGVLHKCYRDSHLGSTTVAAMLFIHNALRTWHSKVTRFIALTNFQRDKLVAAGLPAEKIVVKPNFSPDPGCPNDAATPRAGGLFIGRLSEEKGVDVLVEAASKSDVLIDVVGSGPKYDAVKRAAPNHLRVHGFVEDADLARMKQSAAFLVLPSIVYEGFPMVIAEAFAMGIPIIASRHGGMREIVRDGETGLHFDPGSADDLASKIRWASDNPDSMRAMSVNARKVYEERFSPTQSVRRLTEIYRDAIDEVSRRKAGQSA